MRPVALITGFPRLLARALATEGIQKWNASKVFVLHEEVDQEQANRFIASLPETIRERVVPLVGQLAGVDLRLSGAELMEVQSTVTHVFHAANDVSTPERRLHGTVGALNQLLRLAREMPHLQRFSLFSTAFVSGNRTGIVREEELDVGQRLRTAFEEAMMQSERTIRAAMPRMPITVFRPSAMVGQWRLGEEIEVTEGPTYLLSLMLKLPVEVPFILPGAGFVPFNIVPIEYVVDAAWSLALNPSGQGRTFHLTDPNPMSARQAFELLADRTNRPKPLFGSIGVLMIKQFSRIPVVGRVLRNAMAVLEDLNQNVTYCSAGTLEQLAGTQIRCPPFDAYADTLVAWMARMERQHRVGSRG